jgi:hypothetical protein
VSARSAASRLAWRAATLLALAMSAQAGAAMRVVVVAGLGGEAQYEERFHKWTEQVAQASATAAGDASRVQRLSGSDARREQIQAALRNAAQNLKAGDQFVLVLIGPGTFAGHEYRFNIAGPDITATEMGELLDRIPQGVSQLVVNATSTSGVLADRWAKTGRTLITATRTGTERNAPRFGGYWAEALVSNAADRDKDGNVTAQEAYEYASRKVGESYRSDAAIQSEHSRLTGTAADAGRFVLARLGAAALFASDAHLVALREQHQGIEQRLADLRTRRIQLSENDFYAQLEPVMLELARLGRRVDARLTALGAKPAGEEDAP